MSTYGLTSRIFLSGFFCPYIYAPYNPTIATPAPMSKFLFLGFIGFVFPFMVMIHSKAINKFQKEYQRSSITKIDNLFMEIDIDCKFLSMVLALSPYRSDFVHIYHIETSTSTSLPNSFALYLQLTQLTRPFTQQTLSSSPTKLS